eukprot:jgi/Chlat1/3411/Chrsp23S03739
MIDHVQLEVKDVAKSFAFYEKTLKVLGYWKFPKDMPTVVGFNNEMGFPDFWISEQKGVIEGIHLAFSAKTHDKVKEWYDTAIAAGAKDNGQPGYRKEYHPEYYGAFVIDPDGHRLEVVCHCAQEADKPVAGA